MIQHPNGISEQEFAAMQYRSPELHIEVDAHPTPSIVIADHANLLIGRWDAEMVEMVALVKNLARNEAVCCETIGIGEALAQELRYQGLRVHRIRIN